MSWQPVAEIQLTKDWQLTESITGSVFRLKHLVDTNSPQDLRAVVAQAYDEDNSLTYFNDKVVTFRVESQGFIFPQIGGILNRKFALKRLDNLLVNWTITIEVLDGMPESISLPIALSEVEGLQAELDGKAGAESLNIHVANTDNPHNVTTAQIGAEPAGARNYADGVGAAAISYAVNRTHHEGLQAIATVEGLQTALNSKVNSNDSRFVIRQSLTNPGWQITTGGIIRQWGTARLYSSNGVDFASPLITFPLTFPNGILNVSPNVLGGDLDSRLLGQITPIVRSNSSCEFTARNNVNISGSHADIYYTVLGF